MDEVTQATLNSKTEVSLEFKLLEGDRDLTKGDQMVEMRFYIPGTAEEAAQQDGENIDEEATAASQFHETVKSLADVGKMTGECIVPFDELPFITPRGRYEVEMFEEFMRMHGKSYDYKILYKHIKNLFLLPKSDDVHELFVVSPFCAFFDRSRLGSILLFAKVKQGIHS
jgi:structure-specific recognition protein 1